MYKCSVLYIEYLYLFLDGMQIVFSKINDWLIYTGVSEIVVEVVAETGGGEIDHGVLHLNVEEEERGIEILVGEGRGTQKGMFD